VTRQRLNAREAAEALGVSVDAVRMRARRGTLDSEHQNGRLYVWLDTDSSNVHFQGQVEALLREKDERIEELREQVQHFREVLSEERDARRRADTIIAQLTQANAALAQRVPELEAPVPSEPPGGSTEATEQPGRVVPQPSVESAQEPRESSEMHMPEVHGGPVPRDQQTPSERPWWRRVFGA
jgi:hypothetical protein